MEPLLGYGSLLSFLVILSLHFCDTASFPGNSDDQFPAVYDFIIVGGGTAGCVLANRLSENRRHTVLLLEFGGIPPPIMDIPGFVTRNQANPNFTYQFTSVPQRHQGTNGGTIVTLPLGRVLGGTSQLNHMVFNRASPHNYDYWANVTGDPSWKYDNMLKYFKRLETYFGDFPDEKQHGFNGPMPISRQDYAPGRDEWLAAGRELGFLIRDPNGPQQVSFGPMELTKRFGLRVSSYTGYLKPIINSRRNLRVITRAYATRLIFADNKAIGVYYNVDGSVSSSSPSARFAQAKREVILSAGTYGSATLLMRSGIGPADQLEHAGIKVIKNLPVGENLQDHPKATMHIVLNNKSLSIDPEIDLNQENFELFQKFRTGPFSSVNGNNDAGLAYIASSVAKQEGYPDWSDIQINLRQETARLEPYRNFSMAPWETSIIVNIYLERQKSRGTVKLNPRDVDAMPLIDFNYLAYETDMEILLEAVLTTLKIFEGTRALNRLGARFPPDPVPACSHLQFRSREYWKCFVRQTLLPGQHPAGTCSMTTVVDSSLRVIGMKGLRVVDASVMPLITNTNIQAAVYGIAEKSSDVILRDYQYQ